MNVAHNIYIHVPFCMSKCNYCAFFSRACAEPDWGKYASDIITELEYWATQLGRIQVPTIFFGGGTPSYMPGYIFGRIMDAIRKNFDITIGAEITAESNPGTIDKNKLAEFMTAGMTRISIGVQRLSNRDLEFMGRRHNVDDAIRLITSAQEMGLRTSADFIYGIPGDTPQTVADMCRKINSIGLRHCSMYELTIEENTPFGKMNLDMPTNDLMAQMYDAIGQTLSIPRYEVSNYAAPGNECKHNQNIWDGEPYIGIGRGAAGRILIDGQWYEQMGADALFCKMSASDRAVEKIITGMRTMRGAKITPDTTEIIDMEFVKQNPHLVKTDGDRIRATDRGILILDNIMLKLVK